MASSVLQAVRTRRRLLAFLAALLATGLVLATVWQLVLRRGAPLTATVADLKVVHSRTGVDGDEVRGLVRLSAGSMVETDAAGSARLRMDDGTAIVVDRSTRLQVTERGLRVEQGRVFVQGAVSAKHEVALGPVVALIGAATAGIEQRVEQASIYCASEELIVRAGQQEHQVRSGETATIRDGRVTVAPEVAFDDWTGGLAAPWAALGPPGRAVGELWGVTTGASAGDAGSPLTIRSHEVSATITGEFAQTAVRATYFNGGQAAVDGDFRMAIPPGAIVSRFAWGSGEELEEGEIALADRGESAVRPSVAVLEWAGAGWLRGHLPSIRSGATATVLVEYAEWLNPKPRARGGNLVVQYRYPMVAEGEPPLIGELSVRIDAGPSNPVSIASGFGARASGNVVQLRRSDFRPTADLVVDVELGPWGEPARLYAAPPAEADDRDGQTILVRTEAPAAIAEAGVVLALVLDASLSTDPIHLETARAVITAVLNRMGPRDSVVLLAADQTARLIGPAEIGPATAERRQAMLSALAGVTRGGATDLGRALEAGADALPDQAPSAMVVYIGDGWPTVGDKSLEEIQARLGRRAGGAPRIGAVTIGSLTNRALLSALAAGGGPVLEVADSAGAPQAAIRLLEEALRPTVAGVSLVFGPEVERVYPRSDQAVVSSGTVWAVGRVRGVLPKKVTLRWRSQDGVEQQLRRLVRIAPVSEQDVRRRWAAARVEQILLTGKGREAATDVALRTGLLTPWTGLRVGSSGTYVASSLDTRVLDLSSALSVGSGADSPAGSLIGIPVGTEPEPRDPDVDFQAAVIAAARRVIDHGGPSVRACRDARAALRPELQGRLQVVVEIDGRGRATGAEVRGATEAAQDAALNRCVEVLLKGLDYPASELELTIRVDHTILLPPPIHAERRRCSTISHLAMPLRRGVWRERLLSGDAVGHYLRAKRACELVSFTDKRAFVELMLDVHQQGEARIELASRLEVSGELDAATLLRREAIRRAASPAELRLIREQLLGAEHYPLSVFQGQYRAAKDNQRRLAMVRRFLEIAPHDVLLRRRLVALLEALGNQDALLDEIQRVREDPFAEAVLLADCASTLRRVGEAGEARRTFGELAERAPRDPWARAFLGDRLRHEGWFQDATAAYRTLETLATDEPAAIVRLALAHYGADRLDIANRMLVRVAQTGGRTGDGAFGRLAQTLAGVLLAETRTTGRPSKRDLERLHAAAREMPLGEGRGVILLRAPGGALPLQVRWVPAKGSAQPQREPEIVAAGLGLYLLSFDPAGEIGAKLVMQRREELQPAPNTPVQIDALLPAGRGQAPRLVSAKVELSSRGRAQELAWRGEGWQR